MRHCALCDTRFSPDHPSHIICSECMSSGFWDGSTEQRAMLRALSTLDTIQREEDWEVVKRSSAAKRFVETYLKEMDGDDIAKLLRRILRDHTG